MRITISLKAYVVRVAGDYLGSNAYGFSAKVFDLSNTT
jgi:hypothetical protein